MQGRGSPRTAPSATASASPPWTRSATTCSSSARGARRVAGHRHRLAERRPLRARDSARLREPRPPRHRPGGPARRHDGERITYRGRSAAREVGKTLSLDAAQIDRLAKIMNQFEWVDPKETLARNLRDAGIDYENPTIQRFAELYRHPGPAAPSRAAFRRHGDLPGPPRRDRAARGTPACRTASSSSGTRTTAPTWGSSRSIPWGSA